MAKYCNDGCHAVCDFCIYYIDDGVKSNEEFAGEGFCEIKKIEVNAYDMCEDDFYCFRVR